MATTWRGVFPAVTTKMAREGQVDIEATQKSASRLIEGGVPGIVILPMLGENGSLTLAEREAVVRAAVEVVHGRFPILSVSGYAHRLTTVSRSRRFLSGV